MVSPNLFSSPYNFTDNFKEALNQALAQGWDQSMKQGLDKILIHDLIVTFTLVMILGLIMWISWYTETKMKVKFFWECAFGLVMLGFGYDYTTYEFGSILISTEMFRLFAQIGLFFPALMLYSVYITGVSHPGQDEFYIRKIDLLFIVFPMAVVTATKGFGLFGIIFVKALVAGPIIG